ncbi:TonB-dependent receptor [Telmatobacter sp. DSM 110680]|uniref:TonB-dependent receptor n=1 Tax=Telmatobacter sp. DSM 110680 TaxID=3036704 RepID=A0AAU7DGB7_9BACT
MEVKFRKISYGFLLVPLLFALACVGLHAQANSNITGIVTDQSGAVVAGAKIVLTDPATGAAKSATTSETGLYEIPGLNASNYNMTVTAKGFQTFVQNGIVVNISATFRVDPKLTVGSEATTITVNADALTVQSDSNVVSTLINEQQITELATNGRNIVALAALGLGVSGNLPDSNMPTSVGSNFAISFNGLNQAHNIWLIDGGEAYDRGSGGKSSMMPSQDALGEFQVLASNYPPDYGISSGGTVSMSIKRGTQAFHGELWEFDRNDALQAHNYFDKVGAKKPELRLNIFGGNVGGPLYIPHVYNNNKQRTFFFYNEEWRKIIQGSSPAGINSIPAADFITSAQNVNWVLPAHANKDFRALPVDATHGQVVVPTVSATSALGVAIATYNKANGNVLVPGQAFPDNFIPASLFVDPSALAFNAVGAIPKANSSGDTVVVPAKQPTNVREDLFRIDHNINDKWQLFGHYIGDSVSQTYATSIWSGDNYPTVGSNFSNPSWSSVIKLTGSLSQNVLLEAAFNFDGNKISILPSGSAYTKPSGWGASSFFPASADALNRLPSVNLGSYGTQFDPWSQPWKNAAFDYAEVFGLSVTHGKHAMKFGGGYNRYIKNQQLFGNTNGYYNFSDGYTSPSGTTPGHVNNANLTGDSYLDFMLGLSTSYSQLQTQDIRHYVNQTVSAYAEDNWHITPRLSVQYGVRYDALPHAWERNNLLASFDPAQYQQGITTAANFTANGAFVPGSAGLQTYKGAGFYLNGVTIAGQNGTPRGMTKNFYKTYQPRLGFSYDLTGNGKTVLRGGFGTFFERMQGNDVYNIATAAPFSNTPSVGNTTFNDPLANWQFGTSLSTATLPVVTQGMTSIATNYPAPGVAQYSVGLQREIVPSLVLVTQYVGNVGWHQNVILPINEYPLSTPMQFRADAAGDKTYPGYAAPSTVDSIMARTYPGFGNIQQESNLATVSYSSFQTGLRQQSRHGLSFEIDYTWAHEIDSQLGTADLTGVSNPFNLRYDKGSGNLDRRQVLNMNYEYKLPIFAHSNGLTHSILGGWEVSGTVISETGLPWAGSNAPGDGGSDTVGLGGGYTIRPNFTGKVSYPKTRNSSGVYQWVSPTGFSQPIAAWDGGPSLGFGNAGRDIVKGPGRTNFGTNLYKSFAFTERTHFEFRVESFNTFNHTQFNGFHNNVSGGDFGLVNGVQDPRTFELAGKLVF